MADKIMEQKWISFRCSSSIANFYTKLKKRFNLNDWHWLCKEPTVFFGLYHIGDYIRFVWHRGTRISFWCGGDILNLEKRWFWKQIIPLITATHYCENEVELIHLSHLKIQATVKPMCFDVIDDLKISFKPSKRPHVFVCCHPGYEEQYGVNLIEGIAVTVPEVTFHIYGVKKETWFYKDNPTQLINFSTLRNVVYHGSVSNEQFNREIRNYQAGLRLNDFDGFAEVLAKSILLGQYPISRIYYPYIDYAKDTTSLISLLKDLKNKKTPNTKAREYWLNELQKNRF